MERTMTTRHDKVDVLIIGSGASGAAVAWSLAETKMRILCLEQGDWVKPADYPSNGRDWEARFFGDFAVNPNRRARPTDYPINDANSPIKIVNFNGVGGSTIRSEEHTSELQSRRDLVCRLLLEKKKNKKKQHNTQHTTPI